MKIVREPYGVVHTDPDPVKDTYGGSTGVVFVECMRIYPQEQPEAETVVVFSHPIGGGAFLPMVNALARAGTHIIYCNPRYRGNDSALIMEKCVLDLGVCIRDLARFGYRKVVLGGWSGGGSLSLFYQDQAEHPTITETPAGDPLNLVEAGLKPADGVMLLAAHVSRAVTLTEWLDPSISDESRPFDRVTELNLYDPANPNQSPYSEDFVARFRAAQLERNRRITRWVKATLAELRADPDAVQERPFVVYGTMADVRWLDPAQDPSDRPAGTCYLGAPRTVNDGPVGLARFTTLRSWLSQWSYDETRADGLGNASRISCPVLVVSNTADLACTPSHAQRLYDAVTHDDKELHQIVGADHYYTVTREKVHEAVAVVQGWLARKGFRG